MTDAGQGRGWNRTGKLIKPGGLRDYCGIGKPGELGGLKGARNNHCQTVSLAGLVRVQNAELASITDYDTWLSSAVSEDRRAKTKATGAKLRRAVQMVRNGCSRAEIARATGCSSIMAWVKRLPAELRP